MKYHVLFETTIVDVACTYDWIDRENPKFAGLVSDFYCQLSQPLSLSETLQIQGLSAKGCQTVYMIHTFITSRLDYCKSTLFGIPKKHISISFNDSKIQLIAEHCIS